jgi:hypothetical protein
MQLPNRANAYISPEKRREYRLSDTHPVGRFKAKVFTVWIIDTGEVAPRFVTAYPL